MTGGRLTRSDEAALRGSLMDLPPACDDQKKILLLNIDFQDDFIKGSLAVPNAPSDVMNTKRWIDRNMEVITKIAFSMDSHVPCQIFSASAWNDGEGSLPGSFEVITLEDVLSGKWECLFGKEWAEYYTSELEKGGKKKLTIWPSHCEMGTAGQAIAAELYEAAVIHAAARKTELGLIFKGSMRETEHYSIFEPEVKMPNNPEHALNTVLLWDMMRYDLAYVSGEAGDICVLETLLSIVRYFTGMGLQDMLRKVRVLTDCMSFIGDAEEAQAEFAKMEKLGIQFVKSTDPIE